MLEIDVPLTVVAHNKAGHAAIADNGRDTIILVADQPIAVLKDYTEIDAMNLRFVAKTYAEDGALFEGKTRDAAEDSRRYRWRPCLSCPRHYAR